jgi:hypothetical protein
MVQPITWFIMQWKTKGSRANVGQERVGYFVPQQTKKMNPHTHIYSPIPSFHTTVSTEIKHMNMICLELDIQNHVIK